MFGLIPVSWSDAAERVHEMELAEHCKQIINKKFNLLLDIFLKDKYNC